MLITTPPNKGVNQNPKQNKISLAEKDVSKEKKLQYTKENVNRKREKWLGDETNIQCAKSTATYRLLYPLYHEEAPEV